MSEALDLVPVIQNLKETDVEEKSLKTDLLAFDTTLNSDVEEEEKNKVIDDITKRLADFEKSISPDSNPVSPELKASIDELQTKIAVLEAQKIAEQAAVTNATKKEMASFGDIFKSDDPEKAFGTWRQGIKTKILGWLGIGSAIAGVAATVSGSEQKPKGFFDRAKEKITDLFDGKKNPEAPTVNTDNAEINSDKHKELVVKLKQLNIDFKDPTRNTEDVNETKDRLPLLSFKNLTTIYSVGEKFPGVRVTSTLRSKKENEGLEESAQNSKHLYGFGFDVGRDLRDPAQYTLEDVQKHISNTFPTFKTLIHSEGDNRHLHVETDENTDGKTTYATNEAIESALVA